MTYNLSSKELFQKQDITFSFYCKSGAAFNVSAFVVEESIFGLTRIEVMLVSDDAKVDVNALIDEPATLSLHHKYSKPLRHFSGIVAEVESGNSGHHRTAYRVVILPSLYRLDICSDCRIFQEQSVPDIVRTVLQDYGIDNVTWKIGEGHARREFLVSFNETNLAFIERIMAEEGIYYFFNHGKEGRLELVITDQKDDTPVCDGQSTLDYNPLFSGVSRQPYCWSVRRRQRVKTTGFAQRDRTFKNPSASLAHGARARDRAEKHDYELYRYPGRYKKDGIGAPFSKIRLEAARVDASLIEGESNSPLLATGHKFALTSHPDQSLNSDWRILTMRHEGTQPQVWQQDEPSATQNRPVITPPPLPGSDLVGSAFGIARSASGGLLQPSFGRGLTLAANSTKDTQTATTYVCAFSAQPFKTPYRPPQSQKPLMDGPQIAVVVGPKGEEIYTDEHGRVKVYFPWDRHHDEQTEASSCWIRVASSWAGATWGNISIPRVGQEVIVEFLDGDPDQPIITGRTFHATNKTPYKLPDNKTKMVIRSETHKSGGGAPKFNEISFEDENNQENMFIHAQKDQTVKVLNDRAKRVEANEVQSIGANRSLEVGANAQERIGGSVNRFIGGGGGSLLSELGHVLAAGMKDSAIGSGSVGVQSLSQFVQEATLSTITAEAQSLQAAGAFNSAGGHYTHGGVNMSVSGTALGKVVGSVMPLSGVANTVIEKFQTDTIGIARTEQIGSYKNTTVGHTMTLNVGEEFIIKVGKSRFIMDKDGNVTITGTRFNFAASGPVNINGKIVDIN